MISLLSELNLLSRFMLTYPSFTSDYIGLPPSIDDSTFSTALPRDTDSDGERANEDKDDAMSYFVLKCRSVICVAAKQGLIFTLLRPPP